MIRAALAVIAAFVGTALAADPAASPSAKPRCFTVRGKVECLKRIGDDELGGAKAGPDCQAAAALKKARSSLLAADELSSGREPGAVLCGKLKGDVIIGYDSLRDEQAFCVFGDATFVTTTGLWKRAERN